MKKHLTDGELRASLDGELDSDHLAVCPECQARQRQMLAESQRTAQRLSFLAPTEEPVPAAHRAWSRLIQRLEIQKETSIMKRIFAFPAVRVAAVVTLLLALVLAFPSTRALASELLNLFRVQQVAVVPVDFTGLEQLTGNDALGSQFSEMISSSIEITEEPEESQLAADAAEASELAGFTVRLPGEMTPSFISVSGSGAFTVTVDRDKAQALLDEAGRSDLVLPDSIDGAEISVEIPSAVSTAYGDCPTPEGEDAENLDRHYSDCVILVQIPSPTVNAPADVDVAQLAQVALEFTGMSREDAAAFTSTVDWTSTLVVPIPRNSATHEQVTVDGVTGTLITRTADGVSQYVLMWVKDGIVYAISGLGADTQSAIDMANSLQ
ncbi:MAG: hypothetical protein AB1649_34220 [Chloroflexota bacterium]